MELSGWGRFPKVSANILEPQSEQQLAELFAKPALVESMIARGCGRSYGDSALAARVISSRLLDNFLALDEDELTIRCGAGVRIEQILRLAVPRGWFLPVLPGTKYVSVGGAIAADIHGKNHHHDGTFCDHVCAFTLLLASGETLLCSPGQNRELFHATCGGMGLTGIILDATLRFEKVSSVLIKRRTLPASNLEACFELLDNHGSSKYSVAWLDCLARGNRLGRSLLHLGEHTEQGNLEYRQRRQLAVPFSTPGMLLNRFSMKLFNAAYYQLGKLGAGESEVNYDSYFFPLDKFQHWNRLYGRRGFLQYQLVLPSSSALAGLTEILSRVSAAGKGSFLAVLKKFGEANNNLLSFPMAGYTLALDFKHEPTLFTLLDELDSIVLEHGGRLYLAKDARMSEAVFQASYPNWQLFQQVKQQVDPQGLFSSLQSRRLGLG
jgi:decaprenylphospho-beta-D-ribofuranose 2-oxidase